MSDYPDYTTLTQILGTEVTVPIEIKAVTVAHIDVDLAAQSIGNIAVAIAASAITLSVAIASSAVTLNVNLAASAITLSVAIASSAVTLNVNLAASAITLSVAIASSAVTLNVDVKAQTLTDFKITVNAQNVGVYLQPEWAAKIGVDKNFYTFGLNKAYGAIVQATYTVPVGKRLYICGLSFTISAYAAANADLNQNGLALLYNDTTTICLAMFGGWGGGAIAFPKPIAIPAGQIFRYGAMNLANHACDLRITAWGYEV